MPANTTRRTVARLARVGLFARCGFYLVLAALVIKVAFAGHQGPQADTNGALETIAGNPLGDVALISVAVGYFVFGVARLWGAWEDREASHSSRVRTALQGAFYVVLIWIPLSFVLGHRSTGSNESQHRMAGDLLGLPGGRIIVAVLGVIVIGVCANQIRGVLTHEYSDGLKLRGAPPWVKWLVRVAAQVGIPARAVVLMPVGICLLIAAAQSDPQHAKGLDQLLAQLSGMWWGVVLLSLVAVGLLVFAVYTSLEARYRDMLRAA